MKDKGKSNAADLNEAIVADGWFVASMEDHGIEFGLYYGPLLTDFVLSIIHLGSSTLYLPRGASSSWGTLAEVGATMYSELDVLGTCPECSCHLSIP